MQEISPSRFAGIIETNDALIAGVRGIARRVSFFVGNGLTVKAMKLAMPVSPFRACVVGAHAPYNHGLLLAGASNCASVRC